MKDNEDGTEFIGLPTEFIYAVLYMRQIGVTTKGFTNGSLWVASSPKQPEILFKQHKNLQAHISRKAN